MRKQAYQKPELRNENDEIIQKGAFGKNSAFCNATNDGAFDYILNNLEALHDSIGTSGGSVDLSEYPTKEDLSDALYRYAKKTDLTGYVKATGLSVYAKKSELDIYATKNDVISHYLSKADAEATYAKKGSPGISGNFLTGEEAANKYLTKIDAMGKYATQSKLEADYAKKKDVAASYLTKTDAEAKYIKATGDLTIKDGILRINKNSYNAPVIQTGTAYNDGNPNINIGFGAGANTVVGAGESTQNALTELTNSRREDMYVLADQDVIIKSNCTNGLSGTPTLKLGADGSLKLNDTKVLKETDFSNALNDNGWSKLPNGLILQWGRIANNNGSAKVVFPVAFPQKCFSIAATHTTAVWDPGEVSTWNITTTGFNVGGQAANNYNWYWLAVGY